ncbi:MAG: 3-hydroxyacyl-CoA dehydrogenase family protein [Flavobacteriaceae bacterium]|tara:strand:+ start:49587 stop:50474 length:888 start_codon:yes stop_codon:yes gene_type:complete
MKQIAVIGSGTMGIGIAHVMAQFGLKVSLIDLNEKILTESKKIISINIDRQIRKGVINVKQKKNILSNITFTKEFNESVKNVELVVEAVPENFKLKKKLIKDLDSICKSDVIISSNTSSLSISRLADKARYSERIIGMHFMNPVPVMPLVEIVVGTNTSKKTTDSIKALTKKINKSPLLVMDSPGFVSNRILLPMINEAIETLSQGVADVYSIDQIMKLGMGHPMGPLRLADLIGLDVCLSVLKVLENGFGEKKYSPNQLLIKMVKEGNLGYKTKRGFYGYDKDLKNPYPIKFTT